MSKETVKIEQYNLIDFVSAIEAKVKEGYSVDDTNEGLPQSFGFGLYTCTVSKDAGAKAEAKPEAKVEETQEEAPQEEAPKQTRRGRKKKSS